MARALYIHWPFCLAKCPYCDFNSHVRDSVDHALWEQALLADLQHEAMLAGGEPLNSIFFGGGTPSLMPPSIVERLLAEAEMLWGFAPGIEITLEGNPSSVEAGKFADLARAGINRVSLGLQALDDEKLQFLGRLHDVREGLAALDVAQKHFGRVSFDLIYGLPGQTPAGWHADVLRALSFGTGHLSMYQLTIEPGTRFATMVRQGQFAPLDDDIAADLFEMTRSMMFWRGLPPYEVSNFARAGEESRHNLTYWHYRDYCGIGPGAHGRRGGVATTRHRKPENWLEAIKAKGHGITEERPLGKRERAVEATIMGLRLTRGFELNDWSAYLGVPQREFCDFQKVAFYEEQGLLSRKGRTLRVTEKGMPLLDALIREIVPAALVES